MKDLSGVQLLVTAKGDDGKAHFVEAGHPHHFAVPGLVETLTAWRTAEPPHLPERMGGRPSSMAIVGPGGTNFGITCFAPHSAGKIDPQTIAKPVVDVVGNGLHGHATLDYDVVISGKIDLLLDSGEVRTLTPGTLLVMSGSSHAWRNIYDEPCIFASVSIGATGSGNGT
jgi:hypothetical protein